MGNARQGNARHSRRNGRFISKADHAAQTRVQTLEEIAGRTDEDWDLDVAAMELLERGMALAREAGWQPPAASAIDTGGKAAS